eukprot:gene26295-34396_t
MASAIKTLKKKRKELRVELQTIEKQIFDLETTYLEETKDFGSIFTGWDAYLSLEKVKPKKNITVEERLFSLSSVTSPASRKESQKNKVKSKQGSESTTKKRKVSLLLKESSEEPKPNIESYEETNHNATTTTIHLEEESHFSHYDIYLSGVAAVVEAVPDSAFAGSSTIVSAVSRRVRVGHVHGV